MSADTACRGLLGGMGMSYVFTSESVTEGHPDKVCDFISDSILDAYLEQDKNSRVACETMAKDGHVILGGEISSNGVVDHEAVVREAVRAVGYTYADQPFCADTLKVTEYLSQQAPEISAKVDPKSGEQGAGDQGLMFGFATRETESFMPLPIYLAHRLSQKMAQDRKNGIADFLRPDGKTQVSIRYHEPASQHVETVVVSTQHTEGTDKMVDEYARESLIPGVLGDWINSHMKIHVNPGGSFVQGGPSADCGLTGRKIICDTYGGWGRHGGGAFSGKDASKVDRSAAYFCRYVARRVIEENLADRVEIQVAYAIGATAPVSIKVNTFGEGDIAAAEKFVKSFDFSPRAIVEQLDLLRPVFKETTNYGHFGRPGFSWEAKKCKSNPNRGCTCLA